MEPRDLFGVGVRLTGVYFLSQVVYWGFWAVAKTETKDVIGNPNIPASEDAAYALVYLVIGFLLIALADHIVLLVYGRRIRSVDPADDCSTDAAQDTEPMV